MTREALDILKKLKLLDARLYLEGGVLKLDIQKQGLSDELRAQISEHKAQLIEFLKQKETYEAIPTAPENDSYPLSAQQARLWVLSQLGDEANASYNISGVRELPVQLDEDLLLKSLNILIQRHESLRTSFFSEGGEPRQRVHSIDTIVPDFSVLKLNGDSQEKAEAHISEQCMLPFDLEKGSLLKTGLVSLNEGHSVFYYCMHHIISDAWSTDILLEDLFRIYSGLETGVQPSLPEMAIQYKDYAVFQNDTLKNGTSDGQKAFWKEYLKGDLPQLTLPGSNKRPDFQTHSGGSLVTFISSDLTSRLSDFSAKFHGSLFMTLSAAWNTLVHRYTGQKEFIIGVPVAGREHSDLERQIGFYVNTVPIRYHIDPSHSFFNWCEQVRDNTLDAFSHQSYPFDQIVNDLGVERDRSRNAIFDMMMVFQNTGENEESNGQERSVQGVLDMGEAPAKFDLDITFREVGNEIYFGIVFNSDIYSQRVVEGMMNHFISLLDELVKSAEKPMNSVEFLSNSEIQKLTVENNATEKDYPKEKSLVALFEEQANKTPEAIAVQDEAEQRSYAQLSEESTELAHFMSNNFGLRSGDIIGLILDRSVDYITAMLALFKAGACCCPIDEQGPVERRKQIEANCSQIFGHEQLIKFKKERSESHPEMKGSINEESNDLAYVIYTSGSTGTPKGVMLGHEGIVNHIFSKIERFDLRNQNAFLHASKMFFVGGIWQTWAPLLSGNKLIITGSDKLMDIVALLNSAEANGVRLLEIIPSQLNNLFALNQEEKLSCLDTLILTGEKFNPNYVNRAFETNSGIRIFNTYGQTECSDITLQTEVFRGADERALNVGTPTENTRVYVLDEAGMICPEGVSGEICIAGAGVSKGYLNEEILTNEAFVKHALAPGEKLYKTGDLGRWLEDGTIELSGRKGNQIKIRGQRFELGEIEQAILRHDSIENAVVLLNENGTESTLVAYVISKEVLTDSELREDLLKYLPQGMIPTQFVLLDEFPLMPNGKVNKKALHREKGDQVATSIEYVAARNETEEKLTALWSSLLGKEKIGVHDDFFALGGHSLMATMLASRIHEEFEVQMNLRTLFEYTTIESQAKAIASGEKTKHISIESLDKREAYELSPAQRRFWVLSQISNGNRAYNMSGVLELHGPVKVDLLDGAFNRLIERHEILRTEFRRDENTELKQFVLDPQSINFAVEEVDFSSIENVEERMEQEVITEMTASFDLASGPLLRAKLIAKGNDQFVFVYVMHHIISDGWSMSVMTNELISYYAQLEENETEIADTPLRIQYKDYAAWQNQQVEDAAEGGHKHYWLEQFSDNIPVLELIGDKTRPSIKTHTGERHSHTFDSKMLGALKEVSRQSGGTLFTGLMAVVKALLFKYTGQEDIIIGTPIAGREHGDLEGQIGCYINTLALRTQFSGESSFRDFLGAVTTKAFEAYEHQVYPFDDLVENLNLSRDLSRSALFDVMVVLQNAGESVSSKHQTVSLSVKPYEGSTSVESKFDITFTFHEGAEELFLEVVYNADIYAGETIRRMAAHLEVVLEQVVLNPDISLNEINVLTEGEQEELLVNFNDTEAEIDQELTFIELFEECVERNPDNIAVVFEDRKLSYRDLNKLGNQIGAFLREDLGISNDDRIGIHLEKSEWIIVAMIGILKSGAAYVPMNLNDPEERKQFITRDSGIKHLIDERFLEDHQEAISAKKDDNVDSGSSHSDLVYIIYTSGSTGVPKGVMTENRNLVNYILWVKNTFECTDKDHSVLLSNFAWDGVNTSLFATLISGAEFHILSDIMRHSGADLAGYIKKHLISVVKITPTQLNIVCNSNEGLELLTNSSLRQLIVGGESLIPEDIRKIKELNSTIKVANHYGPTETTVGSISGEVVNLDRVAIGKPIYNTQVHILDNKDQLVPVGTRGEIVIGGSGVARGYLNREELTHERFIPDPFHSSGKLYKTGDLGYRLDDGNIVFLGRIDSQVKVRGYRVELQEIEYHLNQLEAIKTSVVVAKTKNSGAQLTAYVCLNDELTVSELRGALRVSLPDYMIPESFVWVDKIPFTANGKVDTRALSKLETKNLSVNEDFVAPKTETEKKLAAIWTEVLGVDTVGTKDNFFDLGGNSMKIIRVNELLNRQLERRDPIPLLFQYPSIKEYADFIDDNSRSDERSETEIEEAADDLENAMLMFNELNDDEY